MWLEDEILFNYKEELLECDYVSFDIFDTLLLRKVDTPEEIFLKLGKRVIKQKLTRENLSASEFQQIRIISGQMAYDKNRSCSDKLDNEVTLLQIYDQMPCNLGRLNEILELEVELEKENLYLNNVIYDLLKYLKKNGKKVFLISDMYLSKAQIISMLKSCGVDIGIIDDIFVSSEYLFNKRSGRLFEYVVNKFKINTKSMIHIGDNFDADVQGANKQGISAIYYKITSEFNYEIDAERYKYGNTLYELKSLREITGNLSSQYDKEEKFWFKFGAEVLGPVFVLFADYVIDLAIKNDIKIIRPFMREAVILTPLLEKAARKRKYKCDIKPLYISRIASQIPSIEKVNKAVLNKLFEISGMRIVDIFMMFNLSDADLKELNINIEEKTRDISKKTSNKIIDFILQKYGSEMNSSCKINRQLFTDYLKQEGCLDEKIITVDLGYGGTIAENIEKALKIENINSDILHVLMLPSDKLNIKLQEGIKIKSFVGLYNENIDLIEPIIPLKGILEETIMGESGSTTGYRKDNSIIVPMLDVNKIPQNEFRHKQACRAGILKFQMMFHEVFSSEQICNDLIYRKREIINTINRFMKNPSYEEAINLINLHHDDNYGTKAMNKFYNNDDFVLLREIGPDKFLDKAKIINATWPEGEISAKYPEYFYKKVLREGLNLPRYYKEIFCMVEKLKCDNIQSVVIWGTGEVGRKCLNQFINNAIDIEAMVDRKEWLCGLDIEGIPIISPELLAKRYKDRNVNIVIASFSFSDEIQEEITRILSNVKIFKF